MHQARPGRAGPPCGTPRPGGSSRRRQRHRSRRPPAMFDQAPDAVNQLLHHRLEAPPLGTVSDRRIGTEQAVLAHQAKVQARHAAHMPRDVWIIEVTTSNSSTALASTRWRSVGLEGSRPMSSACLKMVPSRESSRWRQSRSCLARAGQVTAYDVAVDHPALDRRGSIEPSQRGLHGFGVFPGHA